MNILSQGVLSILSLSLVTFGDEPQPNKEEQAKLTPEGVYAELLDGNANFTKGSLTEPKLIDRIKFSPEGQFPKAYVLSCVDSRVPVEKVFDQSLGDIFVGRVAGNIENQDQLGSMEYAAVVGGVRLIVVMGHESCGAVKSAIDNVKLGNASALLQKIRPAVRSIDNYKKETSKNANFVEAVVKSNILMTIQDIREKSEILDDLAKEGKIKIVGAYYNLEDGKVDFL